MAKGAGRYTSDQTATHPLTHEKLTDVENAQLPSPRYPRTSKENAENRFYVAEPALAGDMRAKIVKGEKYGPGSGGTYDHGHVIDSGDNGRGER